MPKCIRSWAKAPNDEIRNKIIQGWVQALEKHIKKQEGELQKITKLLEAGLFGCWIFRRWFLEDDYLNLERIVTEADSVNILDLERIANIFRRISFEVENSKNKFI